MTIGEKTSQSSSEKASIITRVISDDKLREVTFGIHLKRVSLLLNGADICDHELIEYCVSILWDLLSKSSHSLRQSFAKCVADELPLMTLAPRTVWSRLESYSKFMT